MGSMFGFFGMPGHFELLILAFLLLLMIGLVGLILLLAIILRQPRGGKESEQEKGYRD